MKAINAPATTFALILVNAVVGLASKDTHDCFCTPGVKIWGCPYLDPPFPRFLGSSRSCEQASTMLKPACGPVRAPCSNPLIGVPFDPLEHFDVIYNLKPDCPGCCTAFGIHSGNIDRGVDQIVRNLVYCRGSIWGYYRFMAPDFSRHITETQYNEPCYVTLRNAGRVRIHIHSNVDVAAPAVCVGKPTRDTSTTDKFISNMRAALVKRRITGVEVNYSKEPTSVCRDSPNTTGRDELGLEITKGLAIKMAGQAEFCSDTTGEFGALWDALKLTFPYCVQQGAGIGSDTTNPLPC